MSDGEETEAMKICQDIVEKLLEHRHAKRFEKPVDYVGLGIPTYPRIIKEPMDLGTVKKRLSKGFYGDPDAFCRDVRLIWSNAMKFNNPGHPAYVAAAEMSSVFEDAYTDMKKESKSRDRGDEKVCKPSTRRKRGRFLGIFSYCCGSRGVSARTMGSSWEYGAISTIGVIKSEDKKGARRIHAIFVNETKQLLTFCWVRPDGYLHAFSYIQDGTIKDNSVKPERIEGTFEGHSFLLCLKSDIDALGKIPETSAEVENMKIPFISYQCLKQIEKSKAHVIRIRFNYKERAFLAMTDVGKSFDRKNLVDTSNKEYKSERIEGWKIRYEGGVFGNLKSLKPTLEKDLKAVNAHLPPHALAKLQESTSFWINATLQTGESNNPTPAKGMCFHPSEDWLRGQRMNPDKAGGVEIYAADDYLSDRGLWGEGGVLMHELAHAFHHKFLTNGFENKIVLEAYSAAISKGLYDKVKVHGPQGENGLIKAYAATNQMEYFAENSVAYMCTNNAVEFNKWYPHNRSQLMKHDIHGFEALKKAWDGNLGNSRLSLL
ncbi:hypothetical protein AAMO2058_000296500 [Amorphochlora amoebiformis]